MGLNSAILGTLNKYTGWQHTQKKALIHQRMDTESQCV